MKRLHQYVLKSFLGPFFMTFFICVFILLMQFLWKYIDDMVGKGLEWGIVAELLLYASMGLIPMAFPLATLLASIMTFGSLGENYELVAMKASGISLFRIMKPLMFVAIGLALFAFYFSNNILPQSNLKFGALMASIKKQKPEMVITEGIFTNDIDGYSIKVDRKSKKTNMLYKILIYDHRDNQGNVSVTVADSGFMKISEDKKFMIMTLFDGENAVDENPRENRRTQRYTFRRTHFHEQVVTVPLKGFDFKRTDEDNLRNMYRMLTLQQLEHVEDSLYTDYNYRVRRFAINMRYNQKLNRSVVDLTNTEDSLRVYHPMLENRQLDYDSIMSALDPMERDEIYSTALSQARMNKQTIDQNIFELYNIKKNLNKYTMEKHRKFTWSVACLIFFFIGAPLGAIIRKGGLGMPTVVSILMFILYYMVSISGEKASREDVWTMAEGMWLATAIFFPLGFFLTYKAATDSGLMNVETYQYKIKNFVNYVLRRKNKAD
ncbi:LptF/LptG family permease [Mangrovibacterium diazotrophicum]|uniref:Lipopolysaccharide export system permease protein n=1 Tax=Mangrovibacterium diazotrophicum TaxID=1261403 RepID=A0A419VX73_9BACT|nr:LptF/LptG family permease [Mangrovibacterium diazotrophicum]RKD87680.1 lipopolysaccharide export system permease protein [Mangrovibacterium diazotrophicum]